MAKPIFLIRFPREQYQHFINLESHDWIKDKLFDYHVVTAPYSGDDLAFECFNVPEITETKFEELKQIILDGIKDDRKYVPYQKEPEDKPWRRKINKYCNLCGEILDVDGSCPRTICANFKK